MGIGADHVPPLERTLGLRALTLMLAPFAPHFAAEAWSILREHRLGDDVEASVAGWAGHVEIGHVHDQLWPNADDSLAKLTRTQSLKVVVQIMGKTRGTLDLAPECV